MSSLNVIKKDFNEVVKTIEQKFGKDYAANNPHLVQYLLSLVQQEKERELTKKINSL